MDDVVDEGSGVFAARVSMSCTWTSNNGDTDDGALSERAALSDWLSASTGSEAGCIVFDGEGNEGGRRAILSRRRLGRGCSGRLSVPDSCLSLRGAMRCGVAVACDLKQCRDNVAVKMCVCILRVVCSVRKSERGALRL